MKPYSPASTPATNFGCATRRHFLRSSAFGLGSIALHSLLGSEVKPGHQLPEKTGALAPHFPARAKRVIFLFMAGGPSHVDLFDPKPLLNSMEGRDIPPELLKDHQSFALIRGTPKIKGSPFRFKEHGQSGTMVSELLPNLSTVVDELTVVRSMKTTTNVHDPAVNVMNCGSPMFDRPTMGAWLSYGLGSVNRDLPSYVVLTSNGVEDGQPLLQSFWGNGFLESKHQGVPFQNNGAPVLYLSNPPGVSRAARRDQLDLVSWMNRRQHERLADTEIQSRIAAYELAFRMQASVPDLADLRQEPEHMLEWYGATPGKASFANNCLLARRLIERDVRFVQLYDRGWDSHTDIEQQHPKQCARIDQPVTALILDLKQRGLLEDTLVLWSGEFGRTPVAQVAGKTYGRDHHPHAFTLWLAGGGTQPGLTHGATDEFGYHVTEKSVPVSDLHATVLHLLGMDHHRLVYPVQGLDMRLTGVEDAKIVHEIIA